MSNAARHNLFYLLESTYGVTPASSPQFTDLRHTGTTLALTKESFQSEELHADRQIRDFRHGVKAIAGDHNFELSYGSFDDFLEAVLMGTWSTDTPSIGTDQLLAGVTRRSFSILRHFTDLQAADKPYHLFDGVELNNLNLTVPASGMVTGSFGVIGQGMTVLQDLTSLGTPTFTAPTTTEPFDSFTGTIQEGGVSTGIVTEVTLSLANTLAARNVIGSDETILPSVGRSNLTGNITAFFEDAAMLEKFINETETSIVFTLLDPAGNQYEFTIPRIKVNGGQPDVSGEGSITISLPFQALYDETAGSNIVIERTPV